MSLFDRIFGRPARVSGNQFSALTAYRPVFSSWGGQLYESELVRAAVDARARHIAKLQITIHGSARPKLQTRLKAAPNEFQTWGQLLYRTSTILDMQNTAFIVPVFDQYGETVGVYSILPSQCELVDVNGVPWIRYRFSNGQTAAIEYSKCGVLTKFQYKDDFFGEPNTALDETMKLMHIQSEAVREAVNNSNTFRFMAKMSNFAKPEDVAKERKRFTAENLRGDGSGGLLLFPNTYSDIQQLHSSPYTVDAAQLELIRTNVYSYFGVNEDILQNRAFGDKWNAFYEGAIEAFSVQFSDVMTKMLFTDRERASGSELFATSNRLQYMSNTDKLNVSSQMADRGIMNRDEIRAIWNLPPLPNGEGQAYIVRGEYKNANEVNNKNGDDENGSKE